MLDDQEMGAHMVANREHWIETLTAEALAFSFLNKAFYEKPTAEFIDTLVTEDLFTQWPLPADDTHTQSGLKLLRAFSAAWEAGRLNDLRKDYQQLFVGPHSLPAPPWESVYLSVEHLVFEAQTAAVRHFYARYGLEAANLYKEPDDHFGLEAAFMAHLCGLGLEAIHLGSRETLQNLLRDQRAFLEEHLLLWAPYFLSRVIKHARTDYYRGVAYLGLGTLAAAARQRDLDIHLEPSDD